MKPKVIYLILTLLLPILIAFQLEQNKSSTCDRVLEAGQYHLIKRNDRVMEHYYVHNYEWIETKLSSSTNNTNANFKGWYYAIGGSVDWISNKTKRDEYMKILKEFSKEEYYSHNKDYFEINSTLPVAIQAWKECMASNNNGLRVYFESSPAEEELYYLKIHFTPDFTGHKLVDLSFTLQAGDIELRENTFLSKSGDIFTFTNTEIKNDEWSIPIKRKGETGISISITYKVMDRSGSNRSITSTIPPVVFPIILKPNMGKFVSRIDPVEEENEVIPFGKVSNNITVNKLRDAELIFQFSNSSSSQPIANNWNGAFTYYLKDITPGITGKEYSVFSGSFKPGNSFESRVILKRGHTYSIHGAGRVEIQTRDLDLKIIALNRLSNYYSDPQLNTGEIVIN